MTENIKGKSDAELKATIAAYTAELERRESIPEELRPDPAIRELLRKRQQDLYGNPVATWYGKEAM
ncbi:MAG: hypothetical protein E7000_04305 [Coriobacteriaceae bacterium]|nr:hypothetical protein [Coriobacteriaceae bacterium]